MKQEKKELIAGIILSLLFIGVVGFIQSKSNIRKQSSNFVLYADFPKADGILIGADVRLAGMTIGKLVDQTINDNYSARLKLALDKRITLSTDSSVAIETDGIMGAKYLEISPGGEEETFKSGDSFIYTQDALLLDELLEKLNAYVAEKNKPDHQEEETK